MSLKKLKIALSGSYYCLNFKRSQFSIYSYHAGFRIKYLIREQWKMTTLSTARTQDASLEVKMREEKQVSPRHIRRIILDQSKRANVGHIGSALSIADIQLY